MTGRVLLTIPDPLLRGRLVARFASDRFRVVACATAGEAAARLNVGVSAMLVTLELPDRDGVDFVRSVSRERPSLSIIALAPRGADERLIACIRAGARGCLFTDDALDRFPAAVGEVLAGGRPMSRGMGGLLLEYVRRSGRVSSRAVKAASPLTQRERAVLAQLARGLDYEHIGRALGISINTVRTFVRGIYAKLDVNSRTEAVLVGIRLGLVNRTPYPGPLPR